MELVFITCPIRDSLYSFAQTLGNDDLPEPYKIPDKYMKASLAQLFMHVESKIDTILANLRDENSTPQQQVRVCA